VIIQQNSKQQPKQIEHLFQERMYKWNKESIRNYVNSTCYLLPSLLLPPLSGAPLKYLQYSTFNEWNYSKLKIIKPKKHPNIASNKNYDILMSAW